MLNKKKEFKKMVKATLSEVMQLLYPLFFFQLLFRKHSPTEKRVEKFVEDLLKHFDDNVTAQQIFEFVLTKIGGDALKFDKVVREKFVDLALEDKLSELLPKPILPKPKHIPVCFKFSKDHIELSKANKLVASELVIVESD